MEKKGVWTRLPVLGYEFGQPSLEPAAALRGVEVRFQFACSLFMGHRKRRATHKAFPALMKRKAALLAAAAAATAL